MAEVTEGGEYMYYSDEIVEEVRSRNDIVDVISGYVKKNRLPFPLVRGSRCTTVLVAGQAEMCLRLLWNTKIIRFRRH